MVQSSYTKYLRTQLKVAAVNACLAEDNASRQMTARGNSPSKSTFRESERIHTLGESGHDGKDTPAKDLADNKEVSALASTAKVITINPNK